jgi:DNA invertase Pin-like site-specific DNA recombinase
MGIQKVDINCPKYICFMNTKKKIMKVAIYSRVSKESSDNTNQLLVLRDYCQKMNYEIHDEYVDVVSGGSSNKPEFKRMMQDGSRRRYDMCIFYALDRFTREGTRKTIQYLQILDDYGITYRSYTEPYIDSSGIFKDVIIALLSTLAKQERIRISERVLAGLAKARQNNRIGGRPTLDDTVIAKIKKHKSEGMSICAIAREMKISRGSVYQYL